MVARGIDEKEGKARILEAEQGNQSKVEPREDKVVV